MLVHTSSNSSQLLSIIDSTPKHWKGHYFRAGLIYLFSPPLNWTPLQFYEVDGCSSNHSKGGWDQWKIYPDFDFYLESTSVAPVFLPSKVVIFRLFWSSWWASSESQFPSLSFCRHLSGDLLATLFFLPPVLGIPLETTRTTTKHNSAAQLSWLHSYFLPLLINMVTITATTTIINGRPF